MKKAGIFGKNFDPGMTHSVQTLIDSLHNQGISLSFYREYLDECKPCLRLPHAFQVFSDYNELTAFRPDIIFSIGGDGTLLQTITLVRDSGIPVLGINTGRMGFLSNTPTDRLNRALEQLFHDDFSLDSRTLIRLESRQGLFGDVNFGLNEFSVHGIGARSLIVVKVWVDGEFLNSYWADGLLIATPTGSTAYSLSCHGPIVSPGAGAFIINPIATHNLSVRPVVIPDASVIKVIAGGRESRYIVGLDSRTEMIGPDQELILRKESFKFNMIKLHGEDFFSTIRQKLLWGLDVRN